MTGLLHNVMRNISFMDKNTFRLDTSGNAELQDHFSRKKAGDKCSINRVEFVLTDKTKEGVEGKITEIELPGDDEVEEKTVTPSDEQPVTMTVMGAPTKGMDDYEQMPT